MNLTSAILVAAAAIRRHNPEGASQTAETAAEAIYDGLRERAVALGLEPEWESLTSR